MVSPDFRVKSKKNSADATKPIALQMYIGKNTHNANENPDPIRKSEAGDTCLGPLSIMNEFNIKFCFCCLASF